MAWHGSRAGRRDRLVGGTDLPISYFIPCISIAGAELLLACFLVGIPKNLIVAGGRSTGQAGAGRGPGIYHDSGSAPAVLVLSSEAGRGLGFSLFLFLSGGTGIVDVGCCMHLAGVELLHGDDGSFWSSTD